MTTRRNGLTLIEIVVAMLVFSTGALGLAAASAAVTRQMSANLMRSRAGAVARSRDEMIRSLGCTASTSGSETKFGIRSTWQTSAGNVASLTQDIERMTPLGVRSDRFLSGIPCD